MKTLNQEQLADTAALIDVFSRQSAAKREQEIAAGKRLVNGAQSRLVLWPHPGVRQNPPYCFLPDQEEVGIWDRRFTSAPTVYHLHKSTTTYFEAYDEWNAMDSVLCYLKGEGFGQLLAIEALPEAFHFVYGVLVYMRLHRSGEPTRVLMGVRAANLAGKNTGTASFPGGLVDAGEPLRVAAPRELSEEGGQAKYAMREGFTFGAHNAAPSITFMCMADTSDSDIAPSIEWKGKRMVWVPEETLLEALENPAQSRSLAAAFRSQGFDLPGNNVTIAPDAVEPARTLLEVYPE